MASLAYWLPTSAAFVWAANATLALTVVLSLALLLARSLKRDPVVRHWTLCIALLLALLCPIAAMLMPATGMGGLSLGWVNEWGRKLLAANDLPIEAVSNEPRSINPAHRGNIEDSQPLPSGSPENEQRAGSIAARAPSAPSERLVWRSASDILLTVISIALLIWFTIAGYLLIKLLRGWWKVGGIVREAKPVADRSLGRIVAETARLLGIGRTPVVACSSRVTSPIVAGIWRPRVILPDVVVDQSTESQIRDVLHEMAHVVRRDLIVVLLQNIAAALFWPHPLLHRLNRSLARAREEICDNYVLQITDAPEFSRTLLRLAELIQLRGSLPLSVAMFNSQWRLESRVAGLLDEKRRRTTHLTRSGKAIVALASIALATIAACGSIALAQDRGGQQSAPSGTAASNAPENTESEKGPKAKGSNDGNPPTSTTDSPPPAKPTQPSKSALESYTSPISVSGRALDANGAPLSGATIYIASQRPGWKRLTETKTDKAGRYQFTDVQLPIERANTNTGHDNGVFIIYGQAKEHGFAWRPWKVYYPQRNGNSLVGTNLEMPIEFMANDKIELDLHFSKSAKFAGRVLTDKGDPIANTKLSIWDCERIPADGYGPEIAGSARRSFAFDINGFELLNAGVAPEMQIRKTDADGRFEFSDVPADCRFRINIQPPGYPTRQIFVSTRAGLGGDYDGIHLYDGAQGIDLRFAVPRSVRIRVVYADTGEKAAKAYVDAANKGGSTWKSSDDNGQVTFSLPPGRYEMDAIPALGTPYLKTTSKLEVKESASAGDVVATLRPAAQIEVHVVDGSTGKGIPGVDLWSEEQGYRDEHYSTSWEAATHIVHRDRKCTDDSGVIHTLFEPGKQRLGVAWRSYPVEYEPGDSDGKVIDCEAGKKLTVAFELHKASTTK
jgi:beta-lactamase regulating signal transducer with metallopeptidase domain/protocatechuate 3,4-dioxygenase beta subunit